MKTILINALNSVVESWPLVFAVGAGQAAIIYCLFRPHLVPEEILLVVALVSFVLVIITYGRISSSLVSGKATNSLKILREHGSNYLIVVILTGLPVLLFRAFVANRLSSSGVSLGLVTALYVLLAVLTVYIRPIVFLKKTNVSAIPAGVLVLFRNLSGSKWIVLIAALSTVPHSAEKLLFRTGAQSWNITFFVCFGVLSAFCTFLSFAAATQYLLGKTDP